MIKKAVPVKDTAVFLCICYIIVDLSAVVKIEKINVCAIQIMQTNLIGVMLIFTDELTFWMKLSIIKSTKYI